MSSDDRLLAHILRGGVLHPPRSAPRLRHSSCPQVLFSVERSLSLFLFSLKVQVFGVPVSCVCGGGLFISLSWVFFPFLVVYKITVHLIVDDNLDSMKYDVYFIPSASPTRI